MLLMNAVNAVYAELSENDRYNSIIRPGLDVDVKTGTNGVRRYRHNDSGVVERHDNVRL